MAVWVKIRKLYEENRIGYYEVFKRDYETIEFYMTIDLNSKKIKFYLNNDFLCVAKEIDCKLEDEPIGPFPGVWEVTYTKAFARALKAINSQTLPEILDYIA